MKTTYERNAKMEEKYITSCGECGLEVVDTTRRCLRCGGKTMLRAGKSDSERLFDIERQLAIISDNQVVIQKQIEELMDFIVAANKDDTNEQEN